MSVKIGAWAAAACAAIAAGCGAKATQGGADDASPSAADVAQASQPESSAGSAHEGAAFAKAPDHPCAWISVSEVEAVVGALAATPQPRDGCRYTLVIPDPIRAQRRNATELNERLRARAAGDPWGDASGVLANYERDDTTYALTLDVQIAPDMAAEAGLDAAARHLGNMASGGTAPLDDDTARGAAGWDVELLTAYGFSARAGHLQITVEGEAPDVPDKLAKALAVRVRERIADLPFSATDPGQRMHTGGDAKNPCSLITRAEAEAVLGPLLVAPFRVSSGKPALAHPHGEGCGYFTAGHHVFSIIATWKGGRETFDLEQQFGGLAAPVMAQENMVLKGPWDEARATATGALLFVKGDHLLEVHYRTSSASMADAMKIASIVMQKL